MTLDELIEEMRETKRQIDEATQQKDAGSQMYAAGARDLKRAVDRYVELASLFDDMVGADR